MPPEELLEKLQAAEVQSGQACGFSGREGGVKRGKLKETETVNGYQRKGSEAWQNLREAWQCTDVFVRPSRLCLGPRLTRVWASAQLDFWRKVLAIDAHNSALDSPAQLLAAARRFGVLVLRRVWVYPGVPSPFFPGILLSRKPPKTRESGCFLKRTMVEKNGESTPRVLGGFQHHNTPPPPPAWPRNRCQGCLCSTQSEFAGRH